MSDLSKWAILTDRAEQLQRQLDIVQSELAWLAATRCEMNCAGCGQFLATEKDFAEHFLIPDPRYLNLGYCPVEGKVSQHY